MANGETYIEEDSTYPDLKRLYEAGVFAIDGKEFNKEDLPEVPEAADSAMENIEEDVKIEDTKEEVLEEVKIENEPAPSTDNASAFICPHCGSEYASARGLATHIKKAHVTDSE